MKVAHILLVHKNPAQVARLTQRLYHPDIDCWIHVDKKSDTDYFKQVLTGSNVFFIPDNIQVDWANYNTVQAMLLCLEHVLASEKKYSYFNFLSGQDYVLQPPVNFLNYLKAQNGLEFIGIQPYATSQQNIQRIKKYHLHSYSFWGKSIFERVINKILPDRKFPYPFDIRKGPQWFAITREATMYVLQFVSNNPKFVNYFKKVHIADEFFFQTVLFNSSFKTTIKDEVFHYTDWSENKKNPKLLTITDRENLLQSASFFARKFDVDIDTKILDLIDQTKLNC
ncbi:beta-1,6-N-acetylglucosaminyltransferase [Ferruginibacter sp.]